MGRAGRPQAWAPAGAGWPGVGGRGRVGLREKWLYFSYTPGDRCDEEVLGLYHVRGGKLARAQMFYFDTAALVSFLAKVQGQAPAPQP